MPDPNDPNRACLTQFFAEHITGGSEERELLAALAGELEDIDEAFLEQTYDECVRVAMSFPDYMRFILIAVFGSSAMLVFAGLKRKKNMIDLLCALILLPALALEIISSSLLGRITLGSVPGLVFGGLVAMAALIPPLRFFLTEKKTEAR